MTEDAKQSKFRIGFLTAIEVPERGYVGGLLVTNHLGRPLEFQCTAPVKPNRTQEILYGPTLEPFILAELIGCTLVEKAAVKPSLVLTEQPGLLELRNHVQVPVACLADDQETEDDRSTLTLGRHRLRFHQGHAPDRGDVERGMSHVPRDADLREPFDRVREALNETTRAAASAAAPR